MAGVLVRQVKLDKIYFGAGWVKKTGISPLYFRRLTESIYIEGN